MLMHACGQEAVLYHVHVMLMTYIMNITWYHYSCCTYADTAICLSVSYSICITACTGLHVYGYLWAISSASQHVVAHSWCRISTAIMQQLQASNQTPAEVLFIDGDQWNPRVSCITTHQAAGMQYAPPHHGQHTQHLSISVRIHADNYMQSNAARLTVRTLQQVPISIPLWTPFVKSTFSLGMRQMQPETQRQNSERCANTLRNMQHTRFFSFSWLLPACTHGRQHWGHDSVGSDRHSAVHSFNSTGVFAPHVLSSSRAGKRLHYYH